MAERLPYHVELRRSLQWELFLAFISPALAMSALFIPTFGSWGALGLATAPLLALTARGLWLAEEWARWAFGLFSSVLAAVLIGLLLAHYTDLAPVGSTVGRIVGIGMWTSFAFRLLPPTMKKRFATARESIARARAVPG
jgi:hypothetical protein